MFCSFAFNNHPSMVDLSAYQASEKVTAPLKRCGGVAAASCPHAAYSVECAACHAAVSEADASASPASGFSMNGLRVSRLTSAPKSLFAAAASAVALLESTGASVSLPVNAANVGLDVRTSRFSYQRLRIEKSPKPRPPVP